MSRVGLVLQYHQDSAHCPTYLSWNVGGGEREKVSCIKGFATVHHRFILNLGLESLEN